MTKLHAPYPDALMGVPLRLPNPDGSMFEGRLTLCGHLYPAIIVTDDFRLVTCKRCTKRRHW